MEYADIVALVNEYADGQRQVPLTEEEQVVITNVAYAEIPCADIKYRNLTLFICRHIVDCTRSPLNRYILKDVYPVRRHTKPYCSWQLIYESVDSPADYSGGIAAKEAKRILLASHPTNAYHIGRINNITCDGKSYWMVDIRVCTATCSCGPISKKKLMQMTEKYPMVRANGTEEKEYQKNHHSYGLIVLRRYAEKNKLYREMKLH